MVERQGSGDEGSEKLKVFLRIRPLTQTEKNRGEEQVGHYWEGSTSVQSMPLEGRGYGWIVIFKDIHILGHIALGLRTVNI